MKIKHLLKGTCLSLALMIGAGTAWAESWEAVELSSLTSSDIFVIVDVTSSKAMSNDKGTSAAPSAVAVTLSSDKTQIISTITDNIKWNISSDGKNTFYPNGSTSTWLYCTNTNNGVRVGTNGNKTFSVYTSENYTGLKHDTTSRYIGVYNNQDWRCYTSVTGNSNIKTTSVKYYKYNANGTSADNEAPKFSDGYPKVSNIKTSSIDLLVKANETCKAYFIAVAAGADAPTANATIANDSVSCASNTETSATISGLTKATAYDIYVIAKDNAGNQQTAATKIANVSTESREISTVSAASKLYTGENATITWTTEGIATDANVKIELLSSNASSTLVASTVNDGSETVKISDATAYGADYKIRVSLADASAVYGKTEGITIIPNITINELLTNTDNNGKSKYENSVVRVKGLVTGIRTQSTDYRNFTIQNGNGVFNAVYAYYCEKAGDTFVALGDSVYVEGIVSYYNGLLEIGSSNNHSHATIINHDNDLPEPIIVSVKDAQNKAYINRIVKLIGVTYTGKSLKISPTDSIKTGNNLVCYMNNGSLTNGNLNLIKNKKYDIIGAISYNNDYQIWPRCKDTTAVSYTGKNRTYIIDDIYMYSSDTTLSALTIGGKSVNMDFLKKEDTVFFVNFNNCKGIAATANHAKAKIITVKVNGNEVATTDLATKTLTENNIVSITVEAEDGTTGTRDIRILKDLRSFNFAELQNSTFNTNSTISLSWTQQKVDNFDIYFTASEISVKLNDNVLTSANTTLNYTVPNGIYGTGYIKAVATADNLSLDSLAVIINDTQVPTAKLKPANGATGIATNVNLIISFDEAVIVAEDAKMKANNNEAKIVVINDTAIKAFFEYLDYATEYTVTLPIGSVTDAAGNNATIGTWKFTTQSQPVPELFFSEYCEGSSNNKYYEIYNPKDKAVDLSNYLVKKGKDGGNWNTILVLSGNLASEDIFIVSNSSAKEEIKTIANKTTTTTTDFNGNDALGLFMIINGDTVLIDMFGTISGTKLETGWDVAGIKNATADHTLIRKNGIICGSTDWEVQAGIDSLDSQWIVKKRDDFSDIGRHGMSLKIAEAENAAAIDYKNHTLTIEAVFGTDLTSITPQLSLSRGATATINGEPVTGNATFDFSQPALLVITSEDGTTTEWTINITVAAEASKAAEIRSFSFADAKPLSVNIDTATANVSVLFDYGTDLTALTPVFTISAAASISPTTLIIDSLQQYTSVAPIDFSTPMTVKVQAQDPTVSKLWTISANTLQPEALTIYQIQHSDQDASAYINKFVSTEGVITLIIGKDLYIQDSAKAWNGLLVYDETGVAKDAKLGDRVKVIGTITEYFTITEIKIVAIEILSSGNSIEPVVLTVEDAKTEAYESVLVTIKNLTCKEGSDNTYTAEDDADNMQVYNKYKFDGFEMTVDSVYNVTGIMYYYSSSKSYEIIPRSTADIVKIEKESNNGGNGNNNGGDSKSAINGASANINIYAYNRTIVVENANADITIFDISGRMVAKRTANNSRIELQLPNSGMYIVKVGDTSQKVVLR